MQRRLLSSPERLAAWGLLTGVVIAFAWAIAARAGVAGMWLDELSHRCGYSGLPVGTLLRYPVSLSYLLTKVCDGIHWCDWSSRVPVVFGSLLVVLGTYWTVAQCGSRYVGVVAAWMVLWHPHFTAVALQNRFYSLGAGLMLCTWVLAVRAGRERTRTTLLVYSAVAFIAMHAWPWGAPWVAGTSALMTYLLIVEEWRQPRAEQYWWRVLNNILIAWLPVVFFGIHYLSMSGQVQSVSKTANDGFWREPQIFSPGYIRETVRAVVQPLFECSGDYLLVVLMASLGLIVLFEPMPMGAFALLTYAVWGVAVHMCNQAQVVPIPRRTVFTQIHTVVLWCAGWSVLAGRVAAWKGWAWLRQRRAAYWMAHASGACILAAALLYYGWDRMILTRGMQALNHGPAHRAMAAVIRRHAVTGARVISLEDGNGVGWGVTAYVVRPAPRRADLAHDIRYVRFSRLPDVDELQSMSAQHTQVWVVGESRQLPATTRAELERSGLRLPFEYDVWWYEPAIAAWDVSQRMARLRAMVSELVFEVRPLDITADEMTNFLARCSDDDFARHLRMLLVRRVNDKDQAYAFAEVLSRYGLHATAIRAACSPLWFGSRHTSMYEWIAGRLRELAARVPEAARDQYEMAAEACLRAAVRRGSPTAATSLNQSLIQQRATAVRLRAPATPVLYTARGLRYHAYFGDNTAALPFVTNLPMLDRADNLTAIALVHTTPVPDVQIPLGQGYGSSNSNSPWFLVLAPSQNHAGFAMQFVGHGEVRAGYPWQPEWSNAWVCLAGVYDASKRRVRLHVNGVCLADAEAPANALRITLGLPLGVGALSNGGYPLHGTLREAAIYNRALSERELRRMLRRLIQEEKNTGAQR